jgi:glycosyltransferase involved in cell wall biosynthesis
MIPRRPPDDPIDRTLRPLRIAQVAPPLERVPPTGYGGTERVVHALVTELVHRGHEVTTFASGDSAVPGTLVPVVPKALRPSGFGGDPWPQFCAELLEVLARESEFDLIHIHLEWANVLLARAAKTPVVGTFHGRIDFPVGHDVMRHDTGGMVAISRAQARTFPEMRWAGVVHNGLDLSSAPFDQRRSDDLVFVGRVAPEKGIVEAIEIAALAGRRLRIAAKVGTRPDERAYYENVFLPALKRSDAEYLGEITTTERDRLMAAAYAVLMPGSWPEPFGLVAIESLACGTPVVAKRVGALPEIIREGVDGFFGDDAAQLAFVVDRVDRLDREEIRRSVLERFSAARMVDDYERIYRQRIARSSRAEIVSLARTGQPVAIPIVPDGVDERTGAPDAGGGRTATPGGNGNGHA